MQLVVARLVVARLVLALSLALTAPGAGHHGKATRPAKARRNGPVVLVHVNTKETMTLTPRDSRGRPARAVQRRFDRFLRCHHTNHKHAMNPRLIHLLYETGRHWPGRHVEVISGYRDPTIAKNPHSPHMKGLACDIRVAGVTNTELRDYLRRTFQKVGVGYYPNSSFVHLDVRTDRSAFWIDYSGPGERAVYSEKPSDDLKTGRADQYHPSKISSDWVEDTDSPREAPPAPAAAPIVPTPAPAAAPGPQTP
jgi:uncharacterized protein YcbK (DUF882 family)